MSEPIREWRDRKRVKRACGLAVVVMLCACASPTAVVDAGNAADARDASVVDVDGSEAGDTVDAVVTADAADAADAGPSADATDARDAQCIDASACGAQCVQLSSNVAHCGRCGMACVAPANGSATCTAGACGIACHAGYVQAGTACVVAMVPRPVAPLSTAIVSSRRPTLRWALVAGIDGARVEICRDRACTMPVTSFDVTGTSGSPAADLPTGTLFWRLRGRTGAATGAGSGPTWQFTVGARTAPRDTSWGTVLDVNGDGFADVAVGAPDANSHRGRVYVFLGSATGVAAMPATALTAPDGGMVEFGIAVASAGDVNGDGFADLVVGAHIAPGSTGTGNTGRAYVYAGSATGLATVPTVSLIGPDGGNGRFGASVSSAGDVNGDGYADLVVGAKNADRNTGRAHVYVGSSRGLTSVPAVSLTGLDGPDGFFGTVTSAGDVDGDGFADLAVGAASTAGAGRVHLYRGSASGIVSTPVVSLTGPDGPGSRFGHAVANAGDVNGDGCADLVVGAFDVSSVTGRAYVYPGGPSGLATAPATSLVGPDFNGAFGYGVSGAGDVNGDGFADIVVGAPRARSSIGRAHVYAGSAMGVGSIPASSLTGPDGANGEFAFALTSIGDINGDGFADLVIGAFWAMSTGRVHVFDGGTTPTLTPSRSLIGLDGAYSRFGHSVARSDGEIDRVRRRGEVVIVPWQFRRWS